MYNDEDYHATDYQPEDSPSGTGTQWLSTIAFLILLIIAGTFSFSPMIVRVFAIPVSSPLEMRLYGFLVMLIIVAIIVPVVFLLNKLFGFVFALLRRIAPFAILALIIVIILALTHAFVMPLPFLP